MWLVSTFRDVACASAREKRVELHTFVFRALSAWLSSAYQAKLPWRGWAASFSLSAPYDDVGAQESIGSPQVGILLSTQPHLQWTTRCCVVPTLTQGASRCVKSIVLRGVVDKAIIGGDRSAFIKWCMWAEPFPSLKGNRCVSNALGFRESSGSFLFDWSRRDSHRDGCYPGISFYVS